MDRLDGITAFAQVVETSSFTAAAQRMKLSKSAVSAHVQRLEDRLGVQLLHRTTRRLATTEAGTAYYRHCVRILAEAAAAEQAAMALHLEPRGTLRISAPDSFGWMHVAPAIATFRARFPDVTIDLRLEERHVDLVREEVDLAIRIGAMPDSALIVRSLARLRMGVCAAPAHLARHGTPATPEALEGHGCLCFPPLWRSGRWHLTGPEEERRVPVSATVVSNSAEVLRATALDGVGIALLPFWLIAGDLRSAKRGARAHSARMDAGRPGHPRRLSRRPSQIGEGARIRRSPRASDRAPPLLGAGTDRRTAPCPRLRHGSASRSGGPELREHSPGPCTPGARRRRPSYPTAAPKVSANNFLSVSNL